MKHVAHFVSSTMQRASESSDLDAAVKLLFQKAVQKKHVALQTEGMQL
jgi:hypothetical protein